MSTKRKTSTRLSAKKGESLRLPPGLLDDIRTLIQEARQDVARSVNAALVLLYWNVGRRIREDILKRKRAEYGKQILPTL